MNLFVISWRNLWRNRRRTFVTLATITASTTTLVLFQGLMVGMLNGNVRNLTDLYLGEVQVHHAEYRERPSMYRSIEDALAILSWADNNGVVASPRAYGSALVGHAKKSAGANVWGLDPERERGGFELAKNVEHGRFLEPGDLEGVVIGQKLANTLGVGLADELIVVVGAADGSIGNVLWTVRGILKSMGEQIDRSAVMVSTAAFEDLFVSSGRIHEIALTTVATDLRGAAGAGFTDAHDLEAALAEVVSEADEVATWQILVPTMAEMVAMSGQYNYLFGVIFFLAAGLGILNSMLMAAYERIPEMGLMKALGTSPFRVFAEMTTEVSILALLGASAGMLIGGAGTLYLQSVGLDTSSFLGQMDVSGVVWDPVWRSDFSWGRVLGATFSMVPVAIISALYPAIIAARVQPVVALRRMS